MMRGGGAQGEGVRVLINRSSARRFSHVVVCPAGRSWVWWTDAAARLLLLMLSNSLDKDISVSREPRKAGKVNTYIGLIHCTNLRRGKSK